MRKPVFGGLRLKAACSATETCKCLGCLEVKIIDSLLSRQAIRKALIRLCGWHEQVLSCGTKLKYMQCFLFLPAKVGLQCNNIQHYFVLKSANKKTKKTVCNTTKKKSKSKPFEPRHEKMCLQESPTRQDTNWPAQLQRPARILKFWINKLEVSFCLGSEQQRRWSDCADVQADLRLCCSHMA